MTAELIYLASPYSSPDPEVRLARYKAACKQTAKMLKAGEIVFSPIVHGHAIASAHDLPTDWEFWKKVDFRMILACDKVLVLMLDGWLKSFGIEAEIAFAAHHNIPVEYTSRAKKSGKILLVDDDPDILNMWRVQIQEAGLDPDKFRLASNRDDAINLLISDDFSLVVCDGNIPESPGGLPRGECGSRVLLEAKARGIKNRWIVSSDTTIVRATTQSGLATFACAKVCVDDFSLVVCAGRC